MKTEKTDTENTKNIETNETTDTNTDRIIGYYEEPNIIQPIFETMTMEEFCKKYPCKVPVMGSHLMDGEDEPENDNNGEEE